MLDFSLTSPVSRKALTIAPDLAFAEAMANPVCKYGYSTESLTAIRLKTEQLTYDDDVEALGLTNDEISAVVMYTFDDSSGAENQPYFHLNSELRKRGAADRQACFECWGSVLKLLMSALDKLPDVEAEVYRGLKDQATVRKQCVLPPVFSLCTWLHA